MANAEKTQLRIVAYRDADMWVAQCLEYDISAQALDMDTLVARMHATIVAEADHTREVHGEAFLGLEPAPSMYESLFERAKSRLSDENDFRIAA